MDNKEEYITINGSFIVEEDDLGPPPEVDCISRFTTLQEWLSFIADNEKPQKAISIYNIDVFEGEDDYILALTGVNTYDISTTHQQIRIEYTPNELYFPLPKNKHEGLTRAQVFIYLTEQFNLFILSDKFKKSFFTEAKSIKTSWMGEIWKRKL